MSSQFALFVPHGEFKVVRQHNILLFRISGAWNLQCAQLFTDCIRNHIGKLSNGRPWVRIMDMSAWELSCPDATDHISRFADWEDRHGCAGRSFCHVSATQRQLLMKKYHMSNPPVLVDSVSRGIRWALRAVNLQQASVMLASMPISSMPDAPVIL